MTDIAAVVQGFGGARPLDGLDDSWTWSTGRMFSYALALTTDKAHAVQINVKGELDTGMAVSVLSYAREHSPQVLSAAPFAVLEGWTPPPQSQAHFDVVAATIPAVHRYHELKHPELNEVTYAVFPAYRCEFSGRETQSEAEDRFDRMLEVADLARLATPWLRMRYDNPRTRGGSVGTELGLAWPDKLITELRNLENSEGAWIDFENFQNKQRRAFWQDGLRLAAGDDSRSVDMTELIGYAQQFLFKGVDDES
ncbi:hypothetical protein [Actinoplanes sp. NBRC 103695]|uniref:hypothetical protein n=1 Tax=Actinoplanes sp. NBRC 103695 TaxID=3032202 RepID=UPI0024A5F1BC|nr:hypothetical protein [Actinoplanes sp. NBRC 103695]GLZ02087.1 hypothetical protein Acsp02_93380 [Actinoplanes sp. NBRC 103695]